MGIVLRKIMVDDRLGDVRWVGWNRVRVSGKRWTTVASVGFKGGVGLRDWEVDLGRIRVRDRV